VAFDETTMGLFVTGVVGRSFGDAGLVLGVVHVDGYRTAALAADDAQQRA
jgi:hypothetical protein